MDPNIQQLAMLLSRPGMPSFQAAAPNVMAPATAFMQQDKDAALQRELAKMGYKAQRDANKWQGIGAIGGGLLDMFL